MKINPEELQNLGERQTVEFKKSLSLYKEAMEALCGMINSDYATGAVFFGVSPDGAITGIEPGNIDSAQMTLAQHARQKFDPSIICKIDILECGDKCLIVLAADRNKEIAYHEYDGRAYIREGTTRRQLSYDEKQQLLKKRNRHQHNGPWRCDRCGSFVGMLNSMVVTDQEVKKTFDCPCGGEFWPAT